MALLCIASVATAGNDAPSAQTLFDQMAKATRERNYEGVFVYSRGSSADTMRIVHRGTNGDEQEHIVSLSGPVHEVVRNNDTVKCFYPDTRSVFVEKSAPRKFLPNLNGSTEQILQNYQFTLVGRDRIADRRAWVIAVLPRSAFRYGYRYWIDADDQLLLRSDVLNSSGTVLEQIVFVELSEKQNISDAMLQPATDTTGFTFYDKGALGETVGVEKPAQEKWQVQWVPDGFSQHAYTVQRLAASEQPVEHIVYSDGIATISVFIEKLEHASDSLQGFTAVGAVNTFSTVSHDHQVTVVGEVPPLTVRQIASSVGPIVKTDARTSP